MSGNWPRNPRLNEGSAVSGTSETGDQISLPVGIPHDLCDPDKASTRLLPKHACLVPQGVVEVSQCHSSVRAFSLENSYNFGTLDLESANGR